MAKKPAQRKKAAKDQDLDAITAAAMALAAERDWREIGLTEIAEAAGVSLSELLAQYPSKLAILDGFTGQIDRRVLAAFEPESESVSARDRLFDVLMRRFDVLEPHKTAIGRIAGAACRDPLIGLAVGGAMLRSMGLMLEAAGVSSDGLRACSGPRAWPPSTWPRSATGSETTRRTRAAPWRPSTAGCGGPRAGPTH